MLKTGNLLTRKIMYTHSKIVPFFRQSDQYASKFFRGGFREALEDESVNEEILQNAFDDGYQVGFKISTEFNFLRCTLKLIEGMYEENRLEIDEELKVDHLGKLNLFNNKLEEIHKTIVSNDILSVDKVGDNKNYIHEKWKGHVNILELKSEATKILDLLGCSISI